MSTSENISLWRKRSEIDYIPPFISLWLSLNAWMRDRYTTDADRGRLELLKRGENKLSDRFAELIQATDSNGIAFRGSLGELQRALVNARIPYDKKWQDNRWQNEVINFASCPVTWSDGAPELESVLKTEKQRQKVKIGDNLWVENNINRVFAAYMEIVYQIRCALFHGNLAPKLENERVIRHLYLTLSMIMEHI